MKKCNTILAVLLAVLMATCILPLQTQAAVRLNVTNRTLFEGDSITLSVSGTKAKIKWSSTNKKTASVTQKGVVTAKKAGTAVIKAKAGKKTLKCTITVQTKFNASEAAKKISYSLHHMADGTAAILKNNNRMTVSVSATLAYYADGSLVDTSRDFNYAFEPGKECVFVFDAPKDAERGVLDYDDCKLTLSVTEGSNLICRSSQIAVNAAIVDETVKAEVSNSSDTKLETIQLTCLFYDGEGRIIGYRDSYAHCREAGSIDYLTFHYPYDENRNTIQPDSYKIYVNSAYIYNWQLES